ncbi:MAG: ATP-binding protein [Elusimicrobia bacterium]|nr:ATP-binding protein [Elusimicrobiota bacterium]
MKRWLLAAVVSLLAVLFISRLPPEAVPGAAPVYLLAVVLAAFAGGFGPGLLSAAIVLGHSSYYRICAVTPEFHFGCFALESLIVGAPATALLVGWLRRQADGRLAEANRTADALKEAQRIGGVGSFEWSRASGAFDCSEEFARLHGLPPGARAEEWLERAVPEDRAMVRESLERAVGEGQAVAEFRVSDAGEERWFRLRAACADDGRVHGTVRDATDEKRALELAAVERRDALQRELIANVSHEFRTPLTAIRGFTESLQADAGDDPELRADFLGTIARHTQRLSRLVDSLLDLAVQESGARPPEPTAVELEGFFREMREDLATLAGPKHVKIEVRAAPGCAAFVDREHLARIVSALCDNAIRSSRRGKRVVLSADIDEGAVSVRVEDEGPGISEADIPHLFERFNQRKRPRPVIGGAGLGLPVAASLARANGGQLSLERTGATGACFLLRAPAAGVAAS